LQLFYLSLVPVVDIGGVRVLVVQGFMDMRMRMIPGYFPLVVVHMMCVGVMMEVLVRDRDMVVPMRMVLGCENQRPRNHQTECDY
jgi:hypothetical protein